MELAYGFIETRGYIAAIEAADAMVKAARVELVKWRKAGGALVLIVVKGELGACQAAVNAGSVAADRVGQLISANVIPRPFDDTVLLVETFMKGRKKQSSAETGTPKNRPQKTGRRAGQGSRVKTQTVQEKLEELLKKSKQGLSLKELSGKSGNDQSEVRMILKQMMDQGLVEKVQKTYFYTGRK